VALGVPRRLRPRIISTFGTTRVVGRQPYAPAGFTPGEFPGTHFQKLSRPQGTWFCRKEPRKKSPVTSRGINPGTVRLVVQCIVLQRAYNCVSEGIWGNKEPNFAWCRTWDRGQNKIQKCNKILLLRYKVNKIYCLLM